ncbi:MAG: metallophosphatase family protein [Bacteroidales bacterium]|nr:metallophosphatase family protein [Bacteroidales bacterium]
MIKIGIISDTHNYIDDTLLNFLKECDEIWHAGDIGDINFLQKLKNFKPLRAVFGNIDDYAIRKELNEYEIINYYNNSILLKHIAGTFSKYEKKTLTIIHQYNINVLVCGHSHILTVKYDKKNKLLYINPGAAGKFGPHLKMTALKLEILQNGIGELTIFEKNK